MNDTNYFYQRAVFEINAEKVTNFQITVGNCWVSLSNSPENFNYFSIGSGEFYVEDLGNNIYLQKWSPPKKSPYLFVTARTLESLHSSGDNLDSPLLDMNETIGSVVSILAALHGPSIIGREVFRGPIQIGLEVSVHFSFVAAQIMPNLICMPRKIEQLIQAAQSAPKSKTSANKLSLIGNLLSTANSSRSVEETIVWLWTILEVHPMDGEFKLFYLKKFFERITGKPRNEVDANLKLGRLHGYRSEILHHGRIVKQDMKKSEIINILSVLVQVAIRDLAGLPYDGRLKVYWKNQ